MNTFATPVLKKYDRVNLCGLSWIQQSYYVKAELLGVDGKDSGPENQKLQGVELSLVSCFITEISWELIKLSEGDFGKCISTVASLPAVDLKP